jgi:hypothetical protein
LPFFFFFLADELFHFFPILFRTMLTDISESLTRWVRPAAQDIRDHVIFSWNIAYS